MREFYTPQEMNFPHEQEYFQKFDGIYDTLTKLHPAYGRMRFRGSPFMPQPPDDLESIGLEDIADHMWLTMLTAKFFSGVLPHATKDIDQSDLADILLIHDIGEISHGDVSVYLQINGYGKNRKEQEDEAFSYLIADLPEESRKPFIMLHDRYEREKNDPHTSDKVSLLAKIIDTIQGNHYVLTHSTDFNKYHDTHKKINELKLLPFTQRMEEVLEADNNEKGAQEINILTRHHLMKYEERGVRIDYPTRV